MDLLTSYARWTLPTLPLLLLGWAGLRWQGRRSAQRAAPRAARDTIADWPPEAVRVLTVAERQAHDLLRRALPGYLVLAQVPLSRFIRVPRQQGYAEWLQRVGLLNVDLLLCDAGSRVLVAIDIRQREESPGARQRHLRMQRVLQATGIHWQTWYADALPSLSEVRTLMTPLVGAPPAVLDTASRPMPLQTAPHLRQLLAQGDLAATRAAAAAAAAADAANEPVPSAFFEESEAGAR